MLLDSEASAELGEAEISDDAESFGSPQAVTDDRETHRDCLIDGQCKPPSSDRPDTELNTLASVLRRGSGGNRGPIPPLPSRFRNN